MGGKCHRKVSRGGGGGGGVVVWLVVWVGAKVTNMASNYSSGGGGVGCGLSDEHGKQL